MVGSSRIAENGSGSTDSLTTNTGTSDTNSDLGLLANHRAFPSIPWITESWLSKLVRYERIAVASPRLGVGIIGSGLIQHHVNLIPTLQGAADFVHVYDSRGRNVGFRPKMATWPLTKQEVLRNKEWSA